MATADQRSMILVGDDVNMEVGEPASFSLAAEVCGRTKRQRTGTDQAINNTEYEEEELVSDMSERDWEILEDDLKRTTTVITFSMTGSSVIFEECTLTLAHFRRDILESCRIKGVLFEDNQLIEGVASTKFGNSRRTGVTYLAGTRVRANSNLTLNELEYVNCNRVSFAQLRSWGVLAVSHASYLDPYNIRQESRRGACDCLQVAAYSTPGTVYSFRLFFPSEQVANRVYNSFLLSQN
ncbi:Hypothetical protein PHPALM_8935 [Phytophthora palmivora]|uniref:Uncharacterized protein n=1 Tax=Phytophthora palmivora TaxID=4796 RepID=A0A2P4Y8L5_9STRA|nr:Hypothetical protein PHPALM_8935 [Phytophthora palmivora]